MDEKIEEMAKIISSDTCDKDCSNRCAFCCANAKKEAKNLYNAGYRKESDTMKEMIEEIDNVKEIFPNDIAGYEQAQGWCMCIDKLKEIARLKGVEVK